jgi:hypothetical protein
MTGIGGARSVQIFLALVGRPTAILCEPTGGD